MRIAVDGRVLSMLPTGLAQYAAQAIAHMVRQSDHEWLLFAPGPLQIALPADDRLRVESSRWTHPRAFTPWQQLVLPGKLRRAKADLFWSPHHYLPALPAGLPAVCTIHDLVWATYPKDMHAIRRALEARLMPHAIRRAARIVAVSQATAETLYRVIPAARGKTTVVHNGLVALPEPSALPLSRLGIDRPFILFVGSIQPRKNLPRLVRAYFRLPEPLRRRHALVIAGAPGWGADLAAPKRAGSQQVGRVIFTGFVSRETLARLYREASALAMPSLEEGFGLPLLEAMASFTPVLASRNTALAEVAGGAALLVEPTDEASIARGLERLLSDASLRVQLTVRGRQRAGEFTWERTARETLRVFDEALAG